MFIPASAAGRNNCPANSSTEIRNDAATARDELKLDRLRAVHISRRHAIRLPLALIIARLAFTERAPE